MIDILAAEAQRRLRARGFHVHCYYGTERLDREMPLPGAIELAWSDGPDTFGPSIGVRGVATATGSMQAASSARVEVRVASTKAGATHAEHRRLARAAVDTLLLELRAYMAKNGIQFSGASGNFVDPPDTTQQHGATYELAVDFARGVDVTPIERLDGLLADGAVLGWTSIDTVTVVTGNASGAVCAAPTGD